MGTLPSAWGPLAFHLPLCNSTSACTLQVTPDLALDPAPWEIETQSPVHVGAGVSPCQGTGSETPPILSL